MSPIELDIPGRDLKLKHGCKIKIGRFSLTVWLVMYGWYSWGGNRSVCGWYLVDTDNPCTIKPLQDTDLDDIYVVLSN